MARGFRWALPDVTIRLRRLPRVDNIVVRVLRTKRPARIDHYSNTAGAFAVYARVMGVRTAVGSPVLVGNGSGG